MRVDAFSTHAGLVFVLRVPACLVQRLFLAVVPSPCHVACHFQPVMGLSGALGAGITGVETASMGYPASAVLTELLQLLV